MDLNALICTLIVGGLLLLSFIKLSNAIEVNRKANIYFGVFVLLWSTFWLDERIIPDLLDQSTLLFAITRFIQFLVPVTFFISVLFYINPHFKYSLKDCRFLIVPLLFLILLFCKPLLKESLFNILYIVIVLAHSLFYTVSAYLKIQKHQKDIELFSSNTEFIDLKWIKYIIYSFITSSVLIIIYSAFTTGDGLNLYINLFFLVVVYLVTFYSIRQKEIYPGGLDIEKTIEPLDNSENNNDTPKNKLLSDDELDKLKAELIQLMDHEKPYLDSELNLVKLSEKLQLSSHQHSYVINNDYNEKLLQNINNYIVQNAEELLTNPMWDHLNILAIGFASGFNSKTSFNTTFKKITSNTPTEYRKKRSNL